MKMDAVADAATITTHATIATLGDVRQWLGTYREGVPLSNENDCQAVEAVEHYFSAEYVHPDPEVVALVQTSMMLIEQFELEFARGHPGAPLPGPRGPKII